MNGYFGSLLDLRNKIYIYIYICIDITTFRTYLTSFFFMRKFPLKAEKLQQGSNSITKLHTIQVHQGPDYRRRNTSPQMAYIITSSKLGKLMCNPIKVPFQMPNLPASKAIEETHNTINNVTETPTEILGQNVLNNR